MRVLVLHQHYWPEVAATAQILSDMCEDLAATGHEVTVLCGQPSYRRVDGVADVLPRRELHNGVRIRRVWSYRPRERTIPRRLAHYGSYFSSSLFGALRERPDVVFVLSTPPLLLGISGSLLKALRGVPFVYSVQDLYPDVAVNLGVLQPGPVTEGVEVLARRLYHAAARVVSLSDAMVQRLAQKGVPRERLEVIPNWADTDAVRPGGRDNAFAVEYGLAGRFVVQYSGNVGLSQGLEHLPAVAELLRELPVTFAVVGDGNARGPLERAVEARALSNVRFLPPQPRDRLPDLLAASDVGLVPMRRGVEADLVPSKLYGIMAAGRPVLASVEPDSEVARVVDRFGCGEAVAPEDPAELAAAIRRLHADPKRRATMGVAGRKACESHFSRRVCTGRYERVLREAAGLATGAAA